MAPNDPVTRLDVVSHQASQRLDIATSEVKHTLADILRRNGMPLNTRCGQRALCDGCIVELTAGALRHTDDRLVTASPEGAPLAVRACEHRLVPRQHTAIAIPPRSALAYQPQVVTDFRLNVSAAHDPVWLQIELPATADSPEAILAFVRERHPQLPVRLGHPSTAHPGAPTRFATVEHRIDHLAVTHLSAHREEHPLGLAIDIGTTTVAVMLVDLLTGKPLARAAGFNQQMHLGDDVLTRINLCTHDPANLDQLRRAVTTQTILPLIDEALRHAGARRDQLKAAVIAANTTMLHLFAGVDPTSMGVAPFTAPFLDHRIVDLAEVADDAFHLPCHLLPGAAAYVGADLTAGVLASALLYDEGPSLLVDVGTNGEIILKSGDRLFGAATAAGPAFEGAGLSCGIRAGDGAISHVGLWASPFRIDVQQINPNGQAPIGICGSTYIDFLAQARGIGLLGETGRFDLDAVPGAAGHIVAHGQNDLAFRVAFGQGKREIVISQRDIAQLLPAKAAIAAGILTLMKQKKLKPADIARLYLAGGFGAHINAANAIASGLLPGFTPQQIVPVGNTSLAGAYLALMDKNAIADIAGAARRIEIIELNLDPGFEDVFIDQLSLP